MDNVYEPGRRLDILTADLDGSGSCFQSHGPDIIPTELVNRLLESMEGTEVYDALRADFYDDQGRRIPPR